MKTNAIEDIVKYSLEIKKKIPQATIIHHVDAESGIWATRKRKIVRWIKDEWQPVADLPYSWPRDIFAFSRITSRIMRADKCNVYVNRLGNVMAIRAGSVYAIEGGQVRRLFSIQGDCVLHRSICEDEQGSIFFGEYFMNPDCRPVRIWRVSPRLDDWQIAAQLEGVRHVHGVYRDPYHTGHYWVTVGDFAGQCNILQSIDQFKSFISHGDGSQKWRAVNLFFTSDHVAWLTDSNLEQNHACRMHRQSGSMETGQPINASVWYGCSTAEGLHVAFTTIEQGPAILSNESQILVSEDAFHWEKVYGFKKDFWKPVKIFKYGVISCPSGIVSKNSLFLSGEGLVGLDGTSVQVAIKKTAYRQ